MSAETAVSLVSSVGFPIVCCYFMWKYINTTLADFTKMMEKNNESTARLCDKIDLIIASLIKTGDEDEQQ
jgi:hypothetical protein